MILIDISTNSPHYFYWKSIGTVNENLNFYIRALMIKTESIRKLSNFNFQWTKSLYQNNLKHNCILFFYIFQGLKMWFIICNNTKENSLWQPKKINVKFDKITSNTWNFQNFTCTFTFLVKFDIYFLGLKILWYKDFVHWKLKLLNFLMDSVLRCGTSTQWFFVHHFLIQIFGVWKCSLWKGGGRGGPELEEKTYFF